MSNYSVNYNTTNLLLFSTVSDTRNNVKKGHHSFLLYFYDRVAMIGFGLILELLLHAPLFRNTCTEIIARHYLITVKSIYTLTLCFYLPSCYQSPWSISRCLYCGFTRKALVFSLSTPTPGKGNTCPEKYFSSLPALPKVLINEVNADPPRKRKLEFVELKGSVHKHKTSHIYYYI